MSKHCCSAEEVNLNKEENQTLRKVFWTVLIINLVMFVVEFIYGYLSNSTALIADSLDMMGDVIVYALSLAVIGKGHRSTATAALFKGWLMTALGLFVLYEAIHKIFNPVLPDGSIITIIGLIAVVANFACLMLLMKYRNGDLNTKSAWICSRNDVGANISVIIAGFFVVRLGSMWPDIIVGLGIASVVLWSSVGIIKESIAERRRHSK